MIYKFDGNKKEAALTAASDDARLDGLTESVNSNSGAISSLQSSLSSVNSRLDSVGDHERLDVQIWKNMNLYAKLTRFNRLGLVLCYLDGRDDFVQTGTSNNPIPEGWRPVDQSARTVGFIGANVATIIVQMDGRVFFWIPSQSGSQSAELNAFTAWRVHRIN